MEIRQLEYFVASVEEKSFQKASLKLFTSQPAISKAIALLEKDVNAKLFERTNKGLKTTPRGEKLYYHAKNILQQVSLMKDVTSEEIKRSLSIASYPSMVISTALTDFYSDNKNMHSLDYHEGNVQSIINLISTGIVELGILYISPNQEDLLNHILNHKQLDFVTIKNSELCLYVGKKHEFYGKNVQIDIEQMKNLKYLRGLRDFFSVEHHFDYVSLNEIKTSNFDDRVLTNSDHLISKMLEKTDLVYLGINTAIKHKELKIIINSEEKNLKLGYVKHKSANLSSLAEEFLIHLEKYL